MVDILTGDARTELRKLPANSVDCVITDPVWPNAPRGMFGDVVDPRKLLADVLQQLPAGVKRIAVVLRSDSDPRFLRAVPSSWPFFSVGWMQYAIPGFYGRALGGCEVVYRFGKPPPPRKGRQLITSMCPVKAQPLAENGHPCPRAVDHMMWVVDTWSAPGETVLDPFAGTGTIGIAAQRLGRHATLIEISPEYAEMARLRIDDDTRESERWRVRPESMPLFEEVAR